MKNLLYIFLGLSLTFACSDDDDNTQTFLEKYEGIIWEELEHDEGFRRYNNDLSNWYTDFDNGQCYDMNEEDLDFDPSDLSNPENPYNPENIYGVYFVLSINLEDVFQFDIYRYNDIGIAELEVSYISTVTNNGNILEFIELTPDGDEGTLSTTYAKASNQSNDFADIPFPCD